MAVSSREVWRRAGLGLACVSVGLLPVSTALAADAAPTPTPTPAPSVFEQMQAQMQAQQQAQERQMMGLQIGGAYQVQKSLAGGTWHSQVRLADGAGNFATAVNDDADTPVWAYSVNKIAVALAVLDKVDRGQLKLDQKLVLTPDIIAIGSGIYHLQGVYGDDLTIANLMTAMLLMSDNTAVRMLSQVVPGTEVNAILANKGLTATHVDPIPGSNRFYLGQTTAREMNLILEGIANHTLISQPSAQFMLGIMRWVNGYSDGIRHSMSSPERAQVATKYGAFEDSRHEVGIMFDKANQPAAIYTFFTENVSDIDNYGATNPAVQAQASLGRTMFDVLNGKWTATPGRLLP